MVFSHVKKDLSLVFSFSKSEFQDRSFHGYHLVSTSLSGLVVQNFYLSKLKFHQLRASGRVLMIPMSLVGAGYISVLPDLSQESLGGNLEAV